MKIIVIILSFFTLPVLVDAQIITGTVTDESTGEFIIGANIFLVSKGAGAISNRNGYFSINVQNEKVLHVSYLGYRTKVIEMNNKETHLSIKLAPTDLNMPTITVSDTSSVGKLTLFESEQLLPSSPIFQGTLAGETNVLKSMESLPGVSTDMELQNGFSVRGGEYDQNLFLLDGVPVYNPSHILGFASIFYPDAIGSVSFISAYLPPSLGGKMSSTTDITIRKGNQYQNHTTLSLSTISASFITEGPVSMLNGSWIISARRSFYDIFSGLLSGGTQENSTSDNTNIFQSIYFYDWYSKFTVLLGNGHSLSASGMLSKDVFNWSEDTRFNWGNSIGSLSYVGVIGRDLLLETKFYFSNYHSEFQYATTIQTPGIQTKGMSGSLEWILGNTRLNMSAGLSEDYTKVGAGIQNLKNSTTASYSIYNYYFGPELFQFYENFDIQGGVRLAGTTNLDKVYVDPRMQIILKTFEPALYSISYTKIHQYLHSLNTFNNVSFGDILQPATSELPPASSEQLSMGMDYAGFHAIKIRNALYYKRYYDMVKIVDYFVNPDISQLKKQVLIGDGNSYGYNITMDYTFTPVSLKTSYSYNITQYKFQKFNNGNYYTPKFSRKHVFNLDLIYEFNKSHIFSFDLVAGTGTGLNVPAHIYPVPVFPDGGFVTVPHFEEAYKFETNPQFRLNVGYKWKLGGEAFKWAFDFSIYNITLNNNPTILDVSPHEYAITQYSMGMIPSVGVTLEL